MIFAGQLFETLEFYQVTETQSETGYKSTTETLMFTCNAERLKNKENFAVDADELFHNISLNFRMRYRAIDETNIVKYKNERYRIISIDRYPRQNEIKIVIDKINE